MADLTPPNHPSSPELRAASKRLLAEAEGAQAAATDAGAGAAEARAAAPKLERAATEVEAAQRRLSDAQRRLLRALEEARTIGGGRGAVAHISALEGSGRSYGALERRGLVGGGDLTDLGRQVAALEARARQIARTGDLTPEHGNMAEFQRRTRDLAAEAEAVLARREAFRAAVKQGAPAGDVEAERRAAARVIASTPQGETRATDAAGRKAGASKRAAEYLERQNEAMRQAGGAAQGELAAAEIVERKALAAERAAAAIRQQNRAMRETPAAQEARQIILPPGVAGSAGAPQAAATQSVRAQADETQRLAETQAFVDHHTRQLAASTNESREQFSRAKAQLGVLDQGLQRHGYLTSEFIRRASQGEASAREWGEQMVGTAAKFGAWTAVAIPVFAVLDGIRQIGSGAITSASGVAELSRYINNLDVSRAREQLRSLARENNVDLADAVTAMAQAGRLRQNQGNQDLAYGTARASLLLSKVGDVDPEQASKYTNAIAQGFGYQADQLVTVVNQLNQAQNNFNLSIRDGASGIARAAGAWTAAGGTFTPLLRLFTVAQQATTASGEEIGTAFRRSAGFITRPHNRQLLAGFGIDATQGADSVYAQAIELVRKGNVRGPDILRLATALSSPQLAASIIAPTLKRAGTTALYQQTADPRLGVTEQAADRGRGSAIAEREKQLRSFQGRIEAIGRTLQRLGSNFEQTGFADPILALVVALGHVLDQASRLLDIFDGLPRPMQHLVGLSLEFLAAVRLARRFNLGDSLVERAPGLQRAGITGLLNQSPERQARRYIQAGLRDSTEFLRDEASSVSLRYGRAAQAQVSINERRALARQQGPLPGETGEAHLLRVARLDRAYETARDRAEDLAHETEVLRAELAAAEGDAAAFRQSMKQGGSAIRFATERGMYVAPTLHRPVPVEPVPAASLISMRGEALDVGLIEGGHRDLAAAGQYRAASKVANAEVAKSGASWRIVQRTAVESEQEIGRGARAMAGLRGVGAGLWTRAAGLATGLAALFGPEFLAFIAAFELIPRAVEAYKHHVDTLKAQAHSLEQVPTTQAEAERQAREARKQQEDAKHPGFVDRTIQAIQIGAFGAPQQGPGDERVENARTEAILRAQRGRKYGFIRDLERDRDNSIRIARSRLEVVKAQREFAERVQRSFEALFGGQKGDSAVDAALRRNRTAHAANAFSDPQTQREALAGENITRLENRAKDNAANMERAGATQGRIGYALRIAAAARQKAADAISADDWRAAMEVYDAAIKSVSDAIGKTLQDDLKLATNEGDRRSAFANAAGQAATITSEARKAEADHHAQLVEAKRQGDAASKNFRRDKAEADRLGGFEAGMDTGPFGANLDTNQAPERAAADKRQIEKLRERQRKLRKKIRQDQEAIRDAERQQKLLEQDIREQRVADYQEGQEIIGADLDARDRDPVHAAQRGLRMWDRIVERARKIGLKGRALQKLVNQQEQAANAVGDAQLDRIESETRYNVALAQTDRGEYVANRAGLLRELQAAQHPKAGAVNPEKVRDLYTRLAELDKAERQRQRQDAVDIIGARYDLLESMVDPGDVVQIAHLEHQKALAILRRGGFKNEAERMRAQADERRTRIAERQTKQSDQVDHYEFLTSIGQLTHDQERAALERFLQRNKNLKDTNRRLYERVKQMIHSLDEEDSSSYDLNPANVRLPSVTELRRTIGGGSRGVTQNNATTVNITVNGPQDYDRLGRVLERTHKGTGRALARAGRRGG